MIVKLVFNSVSTASVKRSHDCTVSGNSGVGGAGEDIADHSHHRNPSDSPARSSAEVVSPSTSMISGKKKMVSLSLIFPLSLIIIFLFITYNFLKLFCMHEFLEANWTKDSINEDFSVFFSICQRRRY